MPWVAATQLNCCKLSASDPKRPLADRIFVSRMNVKLTRILALLAIAACSSDDEMTLQESQRTWSPDGRVEAYVAEYARAGKGHTEIILMFDNGSCGGTAAHAAGTGIGVEILWVDDDNVEVHYPQSRPFQHSLMGHMNECFGRQVRVALMPHNDTNSGI